MKIIIDRIEGGFAIVELKNGSHFNLPAQLLPEGAKEGSVIDISLDKAAEESRRRDISRLENKLFK